MQIAKQTIAKTEHLSQLLGWRVIGYADIVAY